MKKIFLFIIKRLKAYYELMRLHRPIGTYLLLWPTLWALWMANKGQPSQSLVLIMSTGVILMRAAGCVINDIADRHVDGFVARTSTRPLVNKQLTVFEAYALLIVLLILSLWLVCQLNTAAIMTAIIAAIIAISYPFMKRYHDLPQAHLGIAFSMGIPMAYVASNQGLPLVMWLLLGINFIWIIMYDSAYAMCDREDDKHLPIKSTALLLERWLGTKDYWALIGLQIIMVALLIVLGLWQHWGLIWSLALIAVILCFIYQARLLSTRDPQLCFNAFLHNHYVGMIIFIGIACSLLPLSN